MKKQLLLGAAMLWSATALWGAAPESLTSSPYKGATAVPDTPCYLYQVETGLWIDANNLFADIYSSCAILNTTGFDITPVKSAGGYELSTNWIGNGSICGDYTTSTSQQDDLFAMDKTGRDRTLWIIEPAAGSVSNAFTIRTEAKTDGGNSVAEGYWLGPEWDETRQHHMLARKTGKAGSTWQFVTREERLEIMQKEAENGAEVDATWLIPSHGMCAGDIRWSSSWDSYDQASPALDGKESTRNLIGLPVIEFWNTPQVDRSTVIEGLPAGTYSFSVHGYNRGDPWTNKEEITDKLPKDGYYYAGYTGQPMMNLFEDASKSKKDGWEGRFGTVRNAVYVPTGHYQAGLAFNAGGYLNAPVSTTVGADGTLVLGFYKNKLTSGDSFVFKNMYLTYKKEAAAEDLSQQTAALQALIDEAKAKGTSDLLADAITAAQTALAAPTASLLAKATRDIRKAISFEAPVPADPNFYIYLCIGQSNMQGITSHATYDFENVPERFKVMAATDYNDYAGNHRTLGQWYKAIPPLVRGGTGINPADWFGRTMVDNLPEEVTIGVIPVAISGCGIWHLSKEYNNNNDSGDFKTIIAASYGSHPYNRLVELAKAAQKQGVIKGILMHQGESNRGDWNWPNEVKKLYNNLLTDLNLRAEDVPLLAGEVVRTDEGGLSGAHNVVLDELPRFIPTAHVISAKGLPHNEGDDHHFSAPSNRRFGARYAAAALECMGKKLKPVDNDTIVKYTDLFRRTAALVPAGTDISKAQKMLDEATTAYEYTYALQMLRGIRRRAEAIRYDDVYTGLEGNIKANTNFYLYNVGQGQFLEAAGAWGCFPALDYTGVQFSAFDDMKDDYFLVRTNIHNTGAHGRQYFSNYGSLDGWDDNFDGMRWYFKPVDGQTNVFTVRPKYIPNNVLMYIEHAPEVYRKSSGNFYDNTEAAVRCTAERADLTDPNCWWKLVSETELAEKAEKASLKAPADLTWRVINPSFRRTQNHWNSFEEAINNVHNAWKLQGGARFSDSNSVMNYCAEGSDLGADFEVSQAMKDMPEGVYMIECQGFYRNGPLNDNTIEDLGKSHMQLFGPCDSATPFHAILDDADKAPGEGRIITSEAAAKHEVPADYLDASCWYRLGLYKNCLVFEYKADPASTQDSGDAKATLPEFRFGVRGDGQTTVSGDYINIDNFRLVYYGKDTTVEAVKGELNSDVVTIGTENQCDSADAATYNLQGIRVDTPTAPGVYIRGHKKIVIR